MSFSTTLRRKTEPIWRGIFAHPFVTSIGDGSLAASKFRFYLGQDYVFLIEYCRVLALAVAKADDLDAMGRFAGVLHSTLGTEMELHRKYAERFKMSRREIEGTRLAPTTQAYTRHLLAVAHGGTMAEVATSLLPCQWGYCEIGQRLARAGMPRRQPLYAEWIRMYASVEFAALADWLRGLVDRMARQASRGERARMAEHFVTSSRYESLFWDMAWKREGWPL